MGLADFMRSVGSGISSAVSGIGDFLGTPGGQALVGVGAQYLTQKVSGSRQAGNPYQAPVYRPQPMTTVSRLPSTFISSRPGTIGAAQTPFGRELQSRGLYGGGYSSVGPTPSPVIDLRGYPPQQAGGVMPIGFTSFPSIGAGTEGGGFLSEIQERFSGAVSGAPTMFRYGASRARAVSLVAVPHPETGQPVYFRHVGRPILFSGDVATAKRVRRVATRLGSQMGTRRRSSR